MRHFAFIYPERTVPTNAWVLRHVAAIGFATIVGCESDRRHEVMRAHLTGLLLGVRIATGCGFEALSSVFVDPETETPPDELRNTAFIVPKPSRVVVAFGGYDIWDVPKFGRFVPPMVENIGGDIELTKQHLYLTALPTIHDYNELLHACSEAVPSTVVVTRPFSIARREGIGFDNALEQWIDAAKRLESAVCLVEAFDSTVFDKIFSAHGLVRNESPDG
jgi:hypothetical protein